jgi:hypothetical protein
MRKLIIPATLVILGFAWLGLLATGRLSELVRLVEPLIPGWFLSLNLLLIPTLTPFVITRRKYALSARILLVILFVFCFSMIQLSFQVHPRLAVAVTVMAYVEWLLVAVWEKRHNQEN